MKPRHLLLAAVSAALIGPSAHADVLASYGFAGSNNTQRAAPTTAAANLTAGSFSFNSALVNANTGFSTATDGNIFARVNGTSATNPAGAITGNQYVTVTITPNPGFPLNLTSLTVDLGYSLAAASVPAGVGVELGASIFSSVDGFTADQALATKTFTAADQGTTGILYQNVNIDLTGVAYQGLSGPLEFRIYLYDSITGSSPTQPIHRIDNFILNGTVAAPPVTPLSMKDIAIDSSTIQLLLAGTPGSPYRVYRSNDLQGPLYRKRWSERFAGVFPAGVSEIPLSEPMGTEPRGFFVASASEARARIMCVGDSITEGGTGYFIYRPVLNSLLTSAGYRFEFVGSQSNTQGGVTLKHEGYAGERADTIAGFLSTNFPNHIADIVLIHAGHNNDATVDSEATILNRVENATRSMITTCRTHNPKVIILLAQVITSSKLPKYSYIPNLNLRLAELAADLHSAEQPVWIVNQAEGWDPVADTVVDGVHPTEAGAIKMANKWFTALVPLLE